MYTRLKLVLREQEKKMTTEQDNDTPSTPDQGPDANNVATMPDGLPESFWDADSGQVKLDDLLGEYDSLNQFKTEQEARLANRPESADKYELALPEGFELPEGVEFEFDADSDLAKLGRQLAYEMGYSQQDFIEKLVVPYVQEQSAKASEDATGAQEFLQEQKKALGAKADERINAVNAYLEKNLSEKQVQALQAGAFTADAIEALETIIGLKSGPQIKTDGGQNAQRMTQDDLTKMQNDPRYWRDKDPAFVKQVQDGYAKLYPGEHQRIV